MIPPPPSLQFRVNSARVQIPVKIGSTVFKLFFRLGINTEFDIFDDKIPQKIFKDTHREKSTLKLNSNAYEEYEYGHLSRWYIKLTLFKRF